MYHWYIILFVVCMSIAHSIRGSLVYFTPFCFCVCPLFDSDSGFSSIITFVYVALQY